MFAISKLLCSTLALSLAFAPVLQAQQASPPAAPAPVPALIASARTVFISNGGGSNYFTIFTGGADRAYNTFYSDIQKSGVYQLVSAPAQADLILQVHSIAPAVDEGKGLIGYNPQLILSILDTPTNTVLWTTSANVRAAGTRKARDRGFDQSVAVLVDKLGEVTGQPLTSQQEKAVRDNSRMSGAVKAILIVGIAASVALASYGIYRVTHPPTLQQPTLPGFPAVR